MTSQSESQKQRTFKEWVDTFTDELFKWAMYKTSSRETAEDLVQDTFFSAYKAFDKFEGKSSPKTWLFSILNNKIIDHYRKKQITTENSLSLSEEQGTEIADGMFKDNGAWENTPLHAVWNTEKHLLDDPEFNAVMEKCMDDLPDNWRTAITYKYVLDKNGDEISKELNLSSSNYWQIIHRAKLLLKKCIEVKWTI